MRRGGSMGLGLYSRETRMMSTGPMAEHQIRSPSELSLAKQCDGQSCKSPSPWIQLQLASETDVKRNLVPSSIVHRRIIKVKIIACAFSS